ncbi:hypothetical protein ACFQ48_09390 [Hymenobacter caeli]|uniref:DUF937 domain-containing protein n=1 Tax=Hymenobacter caeli TaxID=2735894 RepID=A0ABX2FMB8_9BACT|nr:hypothetical protein [Hymenobacter caeli]NRT18282.1 hypothetical protein [Hymenobacter caeli]
MDSTAATPSNAAQPAVPLTVSDQQTSALLDDTLALLGHGLPDKAAGQGTAEIERWAAVLAASDRPGLAKITQELSQLGELLASPQAAAHEVAELLASLSAETIKVAETAPGDYSGPLGNLGTLLRKAANSLSR